MQQSIHLHIGIHIEQAPTLTRVEAMLASTGHHWLIDPPGEHSLGAYLEIVFDQTRWTKTAPFDLLILQGGEGEMLTYLPTLLTLSRLLALVRLPILFITRTARRSKHIWQDFPNVAVLPEESLSTPLFFQALSRLV